MTEHEVITAARRALDNAGDATCMGNHELYAIHMSELLNLLLEELVDGAQRKPGKPIPERTKNHGL